MARSGPSKPSHIWYYHGLMTLVFPVRIARSNSVRQRLTVYLRAVPRFLPSKSCEVHFLTPLPIPSTIKWLGGEIRWHTRTSAIQVSKSEIKEETQHQFLLVYRTIPKPDIPEGISPAGLLMGHKLETIHSALLPTPPNHPNVPKGLCEGSAVYVRFQTWLTSLDCESRPMQKRSQLYEVAVAISSWTRYRNQTTVHRLQG